jgi:hypothetical protein
LDVLLAAVFAFLSVGCVSAAATALLSDGPAASRFVPATIATAAVFAAFAAWTIADTRG